MKLSLILSTVGLALSASACIPDVYLIDRQTVLELEASGDWPELDQKFQAQTLTQGPVPLEETRDQVSGRKMFSMTPSDKEELAPATPAVKR